MRATQFRPSAIYSSSKSGRSSESEAITAVGVVCARALEYRPTQRRRRREPMDLVLSLASPPPLCLFREKAHFLAHLFTCRE